MNLVTMTTLIILIILFSVITDEGLDTGKVIKNFLYKIKEKRNLKRRNLEKILNEMDEYGI